MIRMVRAASLHAAILASLTCTSPAVFGASSIDEPCYIPITQAYSISIRTGGEASLIRRSHGWSFGGTRIVEVGSYRREGPRIIGTTPEAYFIFEMEPDDRATDGKRLRMFPTKEEWVDALEKLSLDPSADLLRPDQVVASVPDTQARPWRYRMMRGAWGVSDEEWGARVAFAGLVPAFIAGALLKNAWARRIVAVIFAEMGAIVGLLFISGGGPVAMGVFIWWAFALAIAAIAAGLRTVILRLVRGSIRGK